MPFSGRLDTLKLLAELEGAPLVKQMWKTLPTYAAEAEKARSQMVNAMRALGNV